MARYLLFRVLQSALVVIGVITIVFVLTRVTGDPAVLLVPDNATAEEVAAVRQSLGLDRPLHEQYASYWHNILHGDFGRSFRHRQPALDIVLQRLPASVALASAALLVAVVIGLPLGIVSALNRRSRLDRLAMFFALIGQCAPPFWLGIVAILVFGVWLRWLPTIGAGGLEHLVLPATTLGAFSAAITARLFRSSLLEEVRKDYVRTAHAKGVAPRLVLTRHLMRNALIPLVTILGIQVGVLMGGAIIIETVFSYPGMGFLAIRAIYTRDFPIVQAYVLVTTIIVVVANLVVDILYLYLDPRIKYAE